MLIEVKVRYYACMLGLLSDALLGVAEPADAPEAFLYGSVSRSCLCILRVPLLLALKALIVQLGFRLQGQSITNNVGCCSRGNFTWDP